MGIIRKAKTSYWRQSRAVLFEISDMLGRLFQSATLVLLFGMLSLSADAAPITITDLENRTITLKDTPQRIVVGNYILNFLMVGGAESLKKVVALPQDGWQATRFGEYTALTKSFPEIKKIPSIGGYHDNILNTEKIISLKPDLLLINKSQYADNNKRIEVLQKAGIPTVVLDYHALTAANHTQSTKILGELLNQKSTAESLNRRYLEIADIVRERVSKLPESAKARRVYVETGSKGPGEYGNTYNKGVLWGGILNQLQANNIAADMKQPYAVLTLEPKMNGKISFTYCRGKNSNTTMFVWDTMGNNDLGYFVTANSTFFDETADAGLDPLPHTVTVNVRMGHKYYIFGAETGANTDFYGLAFTPYSDANYGGSTGIENVVTDTMAKPADGKIYTIDGRYVGKDKNALGKGLYIMDGKKFVAE